jgi:uncharacterized membrane protein
MNKIVKSAMTSFLALVAADTAVVSTSAMAAPTAQEKCYGIVKAGMNDCATRTASCAGSARKDNQKDAFIFVPRGLCNKIVGGSFKSQSNSEKK